MRSQYIINTSVVVLSLIAILSGATAFAEPGLSHPETLRQELDTVKTELDSIKKQLGEMQKQLAQRLSQPTVPSGPVTMTVGDSPTLGNADAPITIVEFSDYQCPFCKRHFMNTLGELKANYINTGKARYVFRDFPLDSIHPYARKAAEAAHCAGDQGKFWDMHDIIFNNDGELKIDNLRDFAKTMQLNLETFNSCLDGNKYSKKIESDVTAGSMAGVTGTPGFFIGKTKSDGTIIATTIKGAQPAEAFSNVINRLLDEKVQ